MLSAIAAFIPHSTALLFTTGSTPGYPKSITFVLVFKFLHQEVSWDGSIFESTILHGLLVQLPFKMHLVSLL